MIAHLLKKVMNEYTSCRTTKPFKGNPLGHVVRKDIVDEIQKLDCITDKYVIKGSVGQGSWATVPWISILDKRITTTTQNGVYIVYLFSQDGQALYLTLNQGCTELINKNGRPAAIKEMNIIAENIRAHIAATEGFTANNDISLGNLFYEQGCIFYKKYDALKMPSDHDIYSDLCTLINCYNTYYNWINPINAFPTIERIDMNPKDTCMILEDKSDFSLSNKNHYETFDQQTKNLELAEKLSTATPIKKDAFFNIEILADEKYKLLVTALKKDDITTLEQLRQINILRFLNTRDLYFWKERVRIAEELNLILGENRDSIEQPASLSIIGNNSDEKDIEAEKDSAVLDIASNSNYAHTKPYKFVFQGITHETRNWKDLLVQLCESLISIDPDAMGTLVEHPLTENATRLFFSSKNMWLLSPKKLSNGTWVETNYSAKDIVKICSSLCQKCGIDSEELKIYYRKKSHSGMYNVQTKRSSPDGVECSVGKFEVYNVQTQRGSQAGVGRNVGTFDNARAEVILSFIKSSGIKSKTLDDIQSAVPGISRSALCRKIDADTQFVEISKDRYIHRSNIVDLEEAAETMLHIFDSQFAQFDGYTNSRLLFDAVRIDLSLFLNDNDFDNMESVYYLAKHLFSREAYRGFRFVFYSNTHIWEQEPDYPKSLKGLMIHYARNAEGIITRDECEAYLDNIGLSYTSVNNVLQIPNESTFLQYNEGRYLLLETMQINDAWKARLTYCLNDLFKYFQYCIPRDIHDNWFEMLPALPFSLTWTHLLLQEILTYYPESIGFQTIQALSGQSLDTLHAAIVRMDSDFQTFADVVYAYMKQEKNLPQRMSAEELRLQLRDAGMLSGNELILNMHKALNDYRFSWSEGNKTVYIC